jgi:RNA:NAD 2'-phosphotransferase (TPT1/KptA family)
VRPTAGLDAMEKRKSLAPTRNRTPAVQPVARRYTDGYILLNVNRIKMRNDNIKYVQLKTSIMAYKTTPEFSIKNLSLGQYSLDKTLVEFFN